jgi:protein ImuA
MAEVKKYIIDELQRQIISLQSSRPAINGEVNIGWGEIDAAFPNHCFPLGAIHEFRNKNADDIAASSGFICSILSALMLKNGVVFWISCSRSVFPPALTFFNIEPGRIVFIDLKKEKEILWAMEESLKCDGLAAVVGEINEISFTASRRLQLAAEQSRVTGFLIRQQDSKSNTIASISRWNISHLPSELEDGLPGVGFPRWNVSLEKIRNGKPGSWQLEWLAGKFRHIVSVNELLQGEQKRKTG